MDDTLVQRLRRIEIGGAVILCLEIPSPPGDLLARLAAAAGDEARARASRYRFEADAIRCLAGDALLRLGLRTLHGIDGAGAAIDRPDLEKPALAGRPDIQFNISHSGPWVLCAFADRPVGVDVEVERTMADPPARQFMSPPELAAYGALPAGERPEAFFALWTMKESVLKAAGTGLSFDPRRMTVIDAGHDTRVEGGPPAPPGLEWRVHVLPFERPAHAAVCVAAAAAGGPPAREGRRA